MSDYSVKAVSKPKRSLASVSRVAAKSTTASRIATSRRATTSYERTKSNTGPKIDTGTRKVSSSAETGKKDPERYFRFAAAADGDVRRNLSSVEGFYRKRRLQQIKKDDPEGYKKLKRDIEITVAGPSATNYRENARRSMGAALLRNCLYRFLDAKKAKAWYMWVSVVCDIPTVKEFVMYRETLHDTRVALTKCRASLKETTAERDELRHQVAIGRAGETVSAQKLDDMYAELESKTQRTMFIFVRRMYFSRTTEGWNTWKKFVQWQRDHASTTRRALKHWFNRVLSRSFGKWSSFYHSAKRERRILDRATRAAKKWQAAFLTKSYNKWKAEWADAVRRRKLLKRAGLKWMNKLIGAAFYGFRAIVIRLKEDRLKIARAVARIQNRLATAAFNAWHAHVNELIGNRLKVARALGKMRMRVAAAALQSWIELVEENKSTRARLAIGLGRWKNRTVSAAWSGWSDFVERRCFARSFLTRMLGRWKNREVGKGFGQWRSFVAWQVLLEHQVAAEAEEERRKQQVMRNILLRMKFRTAAMVMESWTSMVAERKRIRALLKRTAAKMRNRHTAAAFASWISMRDRRLFARNFLNRMLGRWRNKEKASGWSAWVAYMQTTNAEAEEEARKQRLMRNIVFRIQNKYKALAVDGWVDAVNHRKRNRFLLQRAARRMKNRALSAAFFSWLRHREQRRFARRFLGSMVGRWKQVTTQSTLCKQKNQGLASGWVSWRAYLTLLASAEQEESRKRKLMANIIGRIRNRCAAVALITWRAIVDEIIRNRVFVARCLGKMRNRVVAAAFASLVDFTERRVFARNFLGKMVGRWANKELVGGFDSWRMFLIILDQEEARRKAHAMGEARKQRLMANIVGRIKHRRAAVAMQTWINSATEAKRMRSILSRAAGRMRNRTVAAAFYTWEIQKEHRQFARRFLGKMVGRWKNKELAGAFNAWVDSLKAMDLAAQEENRKQKLMANIIGRIRNRCAAVALITWRATVDEIIRNRVFVARCLGKMRNRVVAAAFASLVDFTERRVFARNFLGKMVGRWANKELVGGFDSWRMFLIILDQEEARRKAHAMGEARKQRLMANIVGRIKHRRAAVAMQTWINSVTEAKRMRTLLKRAAAKIRNRALAAAFSSWHLRKNQRHFARRFLGKMVGRWKNKELAGAFNAWVDSLKAMDLAAQEENRKQKLMANIIVRIRNRRIALALFTWRSTVDEMIRNRVAVGRCLGKMQHRAVAAAFMSMESFVDRRKFARNFLRKMVGRWANKELLCGFDAWKLFLLILDREKAAAKAAEAEVARKQRLMANIIGRIRNRRAAIAMQTWTHQITEVKRHRELLRRAAIRMRNRRLASAQSAWCGHVSNRKFARRFFNKMVRAFELRDRLTGFNSWRAFVALSKLCERQSELIAERRKVQEQQVRRMGLRIMKREMFKCFESWAELTSKENQYQVILDRTAVRLRHRELITSWVSWGDYLERRTLAKHHFGMMITRYENRLSNKGFQKWKVYAVWMAALNSDAMKMALNELRDTKERHRQDTMNNIIRRIKNRTIAVAMQSWVDAVQTKRRNRIAVTRCLGRMKNRRAAAAFATLCEFTEIRMSLRAFCKKMVGRYKNRELSQGMNTWKTFSVNVLLERRAAADESAQLQKELMEMRRNAENRKEKMMLNIVLRIKHRTIATALAEWIELWKVAKRNKFLLKRAAARMRSHKMAAAYASLLHFTERRQLARNFLRKMVGRWANKEKAGAFTSWYQRAMTEKNKSMADFERTQQLIEMQKREKRRQEATMRKILLGIKNRIARIAFSGWHEVAHTSTHNKGLVQRAAMHWFKRALSASFKMWEYFVERRQWIRDFTLRMVGRYKNIELAKGWSGWQHFIECCHFEDEVAKIRGVLQDADVHAKRKLAEERFSQREKMMRNILGRIKNRTVDIALQTWKEIHYTLQRHRLILKRAATRFRSRCLVKTIATWMLLVKRNRRNRRVLSMHSAKRNRQQKRRRLVGTMQAWKMHTEAARDWRASWLGRALKKIVDSSPPMGGRGGAFAPLIEASRLGYAEVASLLAAGGGATATQLEEFWQAVSQIGQSKKATGGLGAATRPSIEQYRNAAASWADPCIQPASSTALGFASWVGLMRALKQREDENASPHQRAWEKKTATYVRQYVDKLQDIATREERSLLKSWAASTHGSRAADAGSLLPGGSINSRTDFFPTSSQGSQAARQCEDGGARVRGHSNASVGMLNPMPSPHSSPLPSPTSTTKRKEYVVDSSASYVPVSSTEIPEGIAVHMEVEAEREGAVSPTGSMSSKATDASVLDAMWNEMSENKRIRQNTPIVIPDFGSLASSESASRSRSDPKRRPMSAGDSIVSESVRPLSAWRAKQQQPCVPQPLSRPSTAGPAPPSRERPIPPRVHADIPPRPSSSRIPDTSEAAKRSDVRNQRRERGPQSRSPPHTRGTSDGRSVMSVTSNSTHSSFARTNKYRRYPSASDVPSSMSAAGPSIRGSGARAGAARRRRPAPSPKVAARRKEQEKRARAAAEEQNQKLQQQLCQLEGILQTQREEIARNATILKKQRKQTVCN